MFLKLLMFSIFLSFFFFTYSLFKEDFLFTVFVFLLIFVICTGVVTTLYLKDFFVIYLILFMVILLKMFFILVFFKFDTFYFIFFLVLVVLYSFVATLLNYSYMFLFFFFNSGVFFISQVSCFYLFLGVVILEVSFFMLLSCYKKSLCLFFESTAYSCYFFNPVNPFVSIDGSPMQGFSNKEGPTKLCCDSLELDFVSNNSTLVLKGNSFKSEMCFLYEAVAVKVCFDFLSLPKSSLKLVSVFVFSGYMVFVFEGFIFIYKVSYLFSGYFVSNIYCVVDSPVCLGKVCYGINTLLVFDEKCYNGGCHSKNYFLSDNCWVSFASYGKPTRAGFDYESAKFFSMKYFGKFAPSCYTFFSNGEDKGSFKSILAKFSMKSYFSLFSETSFAVVIMCLWNSFKSCGEKGGVSLYSESGFSEYSYKNYEMNGNSFTSVSGYSDVWPLTFNPLEIYSSENHLLEIYFKKGKENILKYNGYKYSMMEVLYYFNHTLYSSAKFETDEFKDAFLPCVQCFNSGSDIFGSDMKTGIVYASKKFYSMSLTLDVESKYEEFFLSSLLYCTVVFDVNLLSKYNLMASFKSDIDPFVIIFSFLWGLNGNIELDESSIFSGSVKKLLENDRSLNDSADKMFAFGNVFPLVHSTKMLPLMYLFVSSHLSPKVYKVNTLSFIGNDLYKSVYLSYFGGSYDLSNCKIHYSNHDFYNSAYLKSNVPYQYKLNVVEHYDSDFYLYSSEVLGMWKPIALNEDSSSPFASAIDSFTSSEVSVCYSYCYDVSMKDSYAKKFISLKQEVYFYLNPSMTGFELSKAHSKSLENSLLFNHHLKHKVEMASLMGVNHKINKPNNFKPSVYENFDSDFYEEDNCDF